MLAIIIWIGTWRPYLLGRCFTIQTDQRSLRFILEQRILTPQHQRWMSKHSGYNYEIKYRPGSENAAADTISRRPDTPFLQAVLCQHSSLWEEFRLLQPIDTYLLRIEKLADTTPGQPYTRRNDILCYHNRVVINTGSCRNFTPLLSGVIRVCSGLSRGWSSNFIGPQCTVQLEILFLLVILVREQNQTHYHHRDCFSRCRFRHKYGKISRWISSTVYLAQIPTYRISLLFIVWRNPPTLYHFCIPKQLKRLQQNSQNLSLSSMEFWNLLWVTEIRSLSVHFGKSFGASQVLNSVCPLHITRKSTDRPRLSTTASNNFYVVLFIPGPCNGVLCFLGPNIGIIPHIVSTGMTPFHALYGRDPPPIADYESGATPITELDEQLKEWDTILAEWKSHLETTNNRMKQIVDAKRHDVSFAVGDWIFLHLRPYRQQLIFKRTSHKLSTKFYGTFQISARIGPVTYRLLLPEGTRVYPVFTFIF